MCKRGARVTRARVKPVRIYLPRTRGSLSRFHPLICLIWRQALKDLVVQCWDADPEKRPNFEQVITILEGLLKKIPRETSSGSGGCCSIQ